VAPWLLLLLVRVVRSRRPRAARAEAPSVRGALERARRAAGAGEAEAWAHLAEAVEAQAGTRDREEVARWAGARAQPLLRALDQADALSFAAALVERPSPQDVEAAAAALESGG